MSTHPIALLLLSLVGSDDSFPRPQPCGRDSERTESRDSYVERVLNGLPDDWTAKEISGFLVLNQTDAKYARKVVAHCDAVIDWLDETFPFVGDPNDFQAPVVRVCEDEDGYWSLQDRWSSMIYHEVLTYKRSDDWHDYQNDRLNRQLLAYWFRQRDERLHIAMPMWLAKGLDHFIEGGRMRGRKIRFKPDDWERDWLREDLHEGQTTTPSGLLRLTREQFRARGLADVHRRQAGSLVRLLLSKELAKKRRMRSALADYIRSLQAVLTESTESSAEDRRHLQTQKAVEEWVQWCRDNEDRILEDSWFRTFKGWRERDWKSLETMYREVID